MIFDHFSFEITSPHLFFFNISLNKMVTLQKFKFFLVFHIIIVVLLRHWFIIDLLRYSVFRRLITTLHLCGGEADSIS